jgi:hypothetical protein
MSRRTLSYDLIGEPWTRPDALASQPASAQTKLRQSPQRYQRSAGRGPRQGIP